MGTAASMGTVVEAASMGTALVAFAALNAGHEIIVGGSGTTPDFTAVLREVGCGISGTATGVCVAGAHTPDKALRFASCEARLSISSKATTSRQKEMLAIEPKQLQMHTPAHMHIYTHATPPAKFAIHKSHGLASEIRYICNALMSIS